MKQTEQFKRNQKAKFVYRKRRGRKKVASPKPEVSKVNCSVRSTTGVKGPFDSNTQVPVDCFGEGSSFLQASEIQQ